MIVVGLAGYAQTGKDSVAQILVDKHGFERRAFADQLRAALYALNPRIGGFREVVRYQDVIDEFGYEGARERSDYGLEIRYLLQRLGTDVGRKMFGEDVWVDLAMRSLDPNGWYVFTDCRFLNEARAVVNVGGEMWRVRRPGVGPVNQHISEVGLDDWPYDRLVDNDGNLARLAQVVGTAMAP